MLHALTYSSKLTVREDKNETLWQKITVISIFPLWTFHLGVETFQQHLHMESKYLSWSDIPELVVVIRISLIDGYC
jgi:hypothetical protein